MNITVTAGRKIIGRLVKGEDLLAALEKLAREHAITLGEVRAIGAVSQARLGYYSQAERQYYLIELDRPLEIISLIGNISLKDEKPMVHAHITLCDEEGRDQGGHLAAGTSTGGTLNKAPGRLGDSSLIGCGCYADNRSAAVSTTGWGEPIMKLVLGKWAVDQVEAGRPPQQAAAAAIRYLRRRLQGHGGLILLDPRGRIGLAHSTPRMAWAWKTARRQASGIQLR